MLICNLQDYADAQVKTFVSLSSKVGAGVNVVPLMSVIMHWLEPASLNQSMMDLDSHGWRWP